MPDPILVDLAHRVLELSATEENARRRRLWCGLHNLSPERPLCHYAMYNHVWARDMGGAAAFQHTSGLARSIEEQLRARIWKWEHIADDEPMSPTVWLWCPHPPGDARLWGIAVPLKTDASSGAYFPDPPLHDATDLSALHAPPYEADGAAAARLGGEARDLLGGLLPVKLHTDELHYGPFEWAVKMRGMDRLLYDVIDQPQFVHELMDALTSGMVAYHQAREAAGAVEAESSWSLHPVYDATPEGREHRLGGSWAYCHAQSSASLSPAMYEQFVQPYNERIAALFWRVYYHGCEDLSAKARIIGRLPSLRLFHIGPWTPVPPVLSALGTSVAYEIHAHPARVVYSATPAEMREELATLKRQAEGAAFVLKLCDVETVPDAGACLQTWSRIAREVVEG